jgi:hypothetical protein
MLASLGVNGRYACAAQKTREGPYSLAWANSKNARA